jgi:PAS domain S-box-containing protein
MEKTKRYVKRFEATVVVFFILVAIVPVSVLGILLILVAVYHLPGPPGFYLVLAAVEAVLITAIIATEITRRLAKRITRPFNILFEKTGDQSVEALKEVKVPGGAFGALAEMAECAAIEFSAAKVCTENVLSAVADAAAVVDGEWRVEAANAAFLELLGYTREDVVGRPFERFYEDAPFNEPFFEGLVRRGTVRGLELFLRTATGEKLPVSVSASRFAFRYMDKTGGAFVILARDLTERKALIEELKATRKELTKRMRHLEEFKDGVLYMLRDLENSEQELSEAYSRLKGTEAQLAHSSKLSSLGEVSADVAHELNQPLTVIRGLSQNMLDRDRGSREYDKLKLIDRAARKMESVVKHMRLFARADEKVLSAVDLNRVIKDALIMVKEQSKKHSVRLRLELQKIPPVTGCASRLEQVVINLITNANDAMPGGGMLTISTGSFDKQGRRFVRATFRDTGTGIPEEVRRRIFDPFFTTKEAGKGTGLGLSISQGIISDHKGEISVRSKPGEGTTFEITLPAGV